MQVRCAVWSGSQHFFGSGINGNLICIFGRWALWCHNTSSEVELMETRQICQRWPKQSAVGHNTSSEVELMETEIAKIAGTIASSRHNTSSEVELMETRWADRCSSSLERSQHFFGSGINGTLTPRAAKFAITSSQHFFGSGINGNSPFTRHSPKRIPSHNTSSEVELMETGKKVWSMSAEC